MSFHKLQIHDLSSAKFDTLVARLRHHDGLSLTPEGQGFKVAGEGLSGRLVHDPTAKTLAIELHQVPSIVTPGHIVGRLYDEVLSSYSV